MITIHDLIAAISPDIYCDPEARKNVKNLVKQEGYIKAAEEAKSIKSEVIFNFDEAHKDPMKKWGLYAPIESHELKYNSPSEGLERVYFWIYEFMSNSFKDVEKISDNFASSPGSNHFFEMGTRATRMQEESIKIMGGIVQIVRTVLNLVYDLKEMKLLIKTYEDRKSSNPRLSAAADLSLKQRWIDVVDFNKRGTTSLKQLVAQYDYALVIDAFMAVKNIEQAHKIDVNDRTKRIVEQRIQDYLVWVEESEKQLRTRYNIEIKYLKNQMNTIKLYSRWLKPYLTAAMKLEQNANPTAALVSTFNTILLELKLMGKSDYNVEEDINQGLLPKSFKNAKNRMYHPIVIVEFNFTGIPTKVGQGYGYGGKTAIKFTSYGLNEEEYKVLKEEWEKHTVGEVMDMIEGATSQSLEELQGDIDEFLKDDEDEKKKEEQKKRKEQDVNPFSALFEFLKPKEKKDKEKEDKLSVPLRSDNSYEKVLRSQAIISARQSCYSIFDIYKKSHSMPSHASPYDAF